jgi:hypothetical protein
MELMIKTDLKKLPELINYRQNILLIGSCFTEHIGNTLEELKFSVLQNPNGILFDPASVSRSLISYIQNKKYSEEDLFELNEVWHSWQHHSRFSNINKKEIVQTINNSQQRAQEFLKKADWIIITLGSSFSYRLTHRFESSKVFPGEEGVTGTSVANCHRAPAQWFDKHLLEIDEIISLMENSCQQLLEFNSKLNIIFTISPVRHIRDGVVDNNRSKARLIEVVHYMVNKYRAMHYFPAYELVIDVLRDYRFYDIDMVHPNYLATAFVLDKFGECCLDDESQQLMQEIKKITVARRHKAFQPATKAHHQFLSSNFEKTKKLQEKYPFLNLKEELIYFSQT